MHSRLFYAVLGAASMAAAEVVVLGAAPTPTSPAVLEARAGDTQCFSSVVADLAAPTPEDQDLFDWVTQVVDVAECTVTAPASLSSEYKSWAEQLTDWAEHVEDRAHKETKCGYDTFTLSFTGFCEEAKRTVLFVDSSDETSTLTQAKLPVPTGVKVGAASRNNGMAGAGMALAAVVAAAIAL